MNHIRFLRLNNFLDRLLGPTGQQPDWSTEGEKAIAPPNVDYSAAKGALEVLGMPPGH
jgi:hypothetical protein